MQSRAARVSFFLLGLLPLSFASDASAQGFIRYIYPPNVVSMIETDTAIQVTKPFHFADGTASAPSMAFASSPTTGFHRIASGTAIGSYPIESDAMGLRVASGDWNLGVGPAALVVYGEFDVTGSSFTSPTMNGIYIAPSLTGAIPNGKYAYPQGLSTRVSCGATRAGATGDCYAYGITGAVVNEATSTAGAVTFGGVFQAINNNTTPGNDGYHVGLEVIGGGVTGRTHLYEANLYLNGFSGGTPAAEPFHSFRIFSGGNAGRNMFWAAGGTDSSCTVASVLGNCMDKQNIPGYALGQYFALEARGGRGTLMSGATGQWQVVDGGTKPTCDADHRGAYWHEFGGAGVKDTVEVCAKDAGDAYAWRTIY